MECDSDRVDWVPAAGTGIVYSLTTVRMQISPEFHPPYVVAIVELSEGPRLLTNLVKGPCRIGDWVEVSWRDRPSGPPLPVFEPVAGTV